jgi:hypothetical protein
MKTTALPVSRLGGFHEGVLDPRGIAAAERLILCNPLGVMLATVIAATLDFWFHSSKRRVRDWSNFASSGRLKR